MHIGLLNTDPEAGGYLFMPGDQPLVRPASLERMAEQFFRRPDGRRNEKPRGESAGKAAAAQAGGPAPRDFSA
jgi:CTP:molybdopterin cytidylyltransferase MocA